MTENRVLNRLLASPNYKIKRIAAQNLGVSKNFETFTTSINENQASFQSDVQVLNEKYKRLLELIKNDDKSAIIKHINDMISDMDSLSITLKSLKNKINLFQ